MAKLLATLSAGLDTLQEGSNYLVDRISVLRWDAVYDNYQTWWSERRPPESVPPHLREEYIQFCRFKKKEYISDK